MRTRHHNTQAMPNCGRPGIADNDLHTALLRKVRRGPAKLGQSKCDSDSFFSGSANVFEMAVTRALEPLLCQALELH